MSLTDQEIREMSDEISSIIKVELDKLQSQLDKINEIYQLMGLDQVHKMIITYTSRQVANIDQHVETDNSLKRTTITRI